VRCAKTAEPINLLFGLWTLVGRSKHRFNHICHSREPCKTDRPIKMPFELWARVGTRNHVLDGVQISGMGRDNFVGEKGWPIVKYRDTLL